MVNKKGEKDFAASFFIFPFRPLNRQRDIWDKNLMRGEMKFVAR